MAAIERSSTATVSASAKGSPLMETDSHRQANENQDLDHRFSILTLMFSTVPRFLNPQVVAKPQSENIASRVAGLLSVQQCRGSLGRTCPTTRLNAKQRSLPQQTPHSQKQTAMKAFILRYSGEKQHKRRKRVERSTKQVLSFHV